MANYLPILQGIQGGLQAGQQYRANKQYERAREQELEGGEYDLEKRRANRAIRTPEAASELGQLDPSSVPTYESTLQDPFGVKLLSFFKNKRGARKRKAIQPVGMPQEEFGPPSELAATAASQTNPGYDQQEFGEGLNYADGGPVAKQEESDDQLRAMRTQLAIEAANRREREEGDARPRRAIEAADARAAAGGLSPEVKAARDKRAARGGVDQIVNEYLAPSLGPGVIPQTPTYGSSGPSSRGRARSAIPVSQGEGAVAQGTPGAAPVNANAQPAAPPPGARSALAKPQAPGPKAAVADFSQLDIDAKEVPNMTTDDWKRYRVQLLEAARLSGRPEDVAQVNEQVTRMQQQGFLSYGQQGLALQQAGNIKGATAAYRAAFQYFPNGNDVEFGTVRGKDGRQVIVGFGKDEKTGKRVEGTELVMDPQRVSQLIENFTNPQAFRAWTKDWRDFEENTRQFNARQTGDNADRALRQRQFTEVQKPLAQAQADSLATRGEAALVGAQNKAQLNPRDLNNSERAFRERVGVLGVTDEATADFLASVMSQIKSANPQTPDNAIVDGVMKAQRDGTLQERLNRLGIK